MKPFFHAKVLTLFPEAFPGVLDISVIGKSLGNLWNLDVINIRDYALDRRQTVDDKPAGGGHGMVMKPDILSKAIEANSSEGIYLMSPRGSVFSQKKAHEILQKKQATFICGRYEGVDQRLIDYYNLEEISIGDYIVSGGEVAAQTIIDACVRLIPGVLSGEEAHEEESVSPGEYEFLLEYPHYTKPNLWNNRAIPEILFSGDHKKIKLWRLEEAKKLTKERRPDLWERYISKKT